MHIIKFNHKVSRKIILFIINFLVTYNLEISEVFVEVDSSQSCQIY